MSVCFLVRKEIERVKKKGKDRERKKEEKKDRKIKCMSMCETFKYKTLISMYNN